MREIKFRAWNTKVKLMSNTFNLGDLEGYEGECNAVNIIGFGNLCSHNGGKYLAYPQIDSDNGINQELIIMQFTGLKDKNGKEIYEGDIIRCDTWIICEYRGTPEIIASIIFNDGSFIIRGINEKALVRLDKETIKQYNIKKIGNIYENPDLLEGAGK